MQLRLLIILIVFLVACKDSNTNTQDLDLMRYGMPIKIKAPLDAEIETNDFGFMKDITIKDEDGYFLQILSSEAIQLDPVKIKQEKLREAKNNPFFSSIIQDDEHGFIFEKLRSDSSKNYDFRHVRIQGDNQYIFQAGMIGKFSKEQIEEIYNSVK